MKIAELRESKRQEMFCRLTKEHIDNFYLQCGNDDVDAWGFVKKHPIDFDGNDKELMAIRFFSKYFIMKNKIEDASDFYVHGSEYRFDRLSRRRNAGILMRYAKMEKYYDLLKTGENFELLKKHLGNWFYCITMRVGDVVYVYDFVQNKLSKKKYYDVNISRYLGMYNWYYNPNFDKNKVLEWWYRDYNDVYGKTCEQCGKTYNVAYVDNSKFTEVDGKLYCDDCLKRLNYGKCDVSGEIGFRVKIIFSCRQDKKEVLNKLGLKTKKKELFIKKQVLDEKGIWFCEDCGCAYVADNKNCCHKCRYKKINSYSDKRFKKMIWDNEDTDELFGCEIETEYRGNVENGAIVINKGLEDYVYLKSDCSINHGFEIVSYAMSYEMWKHSIGRFKKVFEEFKKKGGYSQSADTTGLHIHISRKSFKDAKHLARFGRCFYLNKFFIQTIANRNFNRYCTFDEIRALEGNIETQLGCDLYETFGSRYNFVNFDNRNTVEIRCFNGTLNVDVVMACIELCKLIKRYSELNLEISFDGMLNFIKKNTKSKALKGIIKLYEISNKYFKENK